MWSRQWMIVTIAFIIQSIHLVVGQTSSSPSWFPIGLIQAGQKHIVVSGTHQNTNWGDPYIVTYNPTFTQSPYTALGIFQFESSTIPCTAIQTKININDYNNLSVMKIMLVYYNTMAYKNLKVSYIAVDSSLTYLKIDYFQRTSLGAATSGSGLRNFVGSSTLAFTLNISHTISVIPLLIGINASSATGDYSVDWKTTIQTSNSINYYLTVDGNTIVTQLVSYILLYDKTSGQQTQQLFLDQIFFTGYNNLQQVINLPPIMTKNFHVGINSFTIKSLKIQFDKQIQTINGFNYTALNFSAWNFRKRACASSQPYYQRNTQLCYSTCPSGYLNTASSYCTTCHSYLSGCKTCTSTTVCTSCLEIYNLSANKCVCIVGANTNGTCFNDCPALTPYYLNLQCLQVCPTGYQPTNNTYKQCKVVCSTKCLTCITSQVCLSCDQIYRTFNATTKQCVCYSGQASNGSCFNQCPVQLPYYYEKTKSCLATCPSDSIQIIQSTLKSCKQCSTLFPSCQQCSISICNTCMTNFKFQNSSNISCVCSTSGGAYLDSFGNCNLCHRTCLYCSGPADNMCIIECDKNIYRVLSNGKCICDTIYTEDANGNCTKSSLISNCPQGFQKVQFCEEICGDGKVIYADCDDGNNINGDGCSAQCLVEQDYICLPGSLTQKSICSYSKPIQFVVVSAIKDIYSNKITLSYKISPILPFFSELIDFTNNSKFSDKSQIFVARVYEPVQLISAVFDQSTKLFVAQLVYLESIHLKDIQIIFTPPLRPTTFAVGLSAQTFNVKTTNNLAAIMYSNEIYKNVKIVKIFTQVLYLTALGLFLISLFFSKMIGLQLITVFQVSFLSFSILDYAQPLLGVILEWQYIFGYNKLNVVPSDVLPLEGNLQQMGFARQFGSSCNTMLLVILGIYGFSILLSIMSALTSKSLQRKFKQAAKFFPLQVAFGLTIFMLMNVVISVGCQAQSGNLLKFSNFKSKGFQIFAVFSIIGSLVALYATIDKNTQNNYFYKRDAKWPRYHCFLFVIRNIALSLGIFFFTIIKVVLEGIMILEVVYIFVTIIIKPYRRIFDFVRFLIIELTIMFILASRYIEGKYIKVETLVDDKWGKFYNYNVYIEISLLGLALIFSIVSLIFHLYKATVDKKIHSQKNFGKTGAKVHQQRNVKRQVAQINKKPIIINNELFFNEDEDQHMPHQREDRQDQEKSDASVSSFSSWYYNNKKKLKDQQQQ